MAGHEAQLDERLHADRKQKVEDLVCIEERIEKGVAFADQRAHVVAQQAVKAHMAESKLVVRAPHLRLPVRPQRQRRMAAADGMFPEMRQARSRTGEVATEIRRHDQSPSAGRGRVSKHPQRAGWMKTRCRQAVVATTKPPEDRPLLVSRD